MSQPDRSTTASRIGMPAEHGGSGTEIAGADLARRMDERIRLTLKYGKAGGLTTDARHAQANPALATGRQAVDDLSGIVRLPRLPTHRPPATTLHALQEWEGYVVEFDETEFTARLTDLTAGASHEGEEATIPRAELSDRDNARIREGSIFRWVIGYERSAAGTKKRVSHIVFRDLPAFTETDRRRGDAWAQEMMQSFGL